MATSFVPKIGNRSSMPSVSASTAGVLYVCADDGTLWVDYINSSGTATRKQIGAAINGTSVTLTVAGWNSSTLSQTVTVSGIVADESAQKIEWMAAAASLTAANEACILCTAQGANSLTFTCQTVPTSAITLYITYQDVIFK